MTAFNPIEAARLAEEFAEDSGGFNGEFCFVEAHTEDHGIGNIGDFVKVDDALAYLTDENDPVTIASPIDQHVAEPIARMLNNARSASEQLRAACLEIEALRVDRKQLGEVLSKTNEALNRAGCYSALYYWEHIDNIAADRDRLAARVHELTLLAADACDIASGQFYSGGRLRDDARTLELFERIAAIRAALKGGSK